MDMDIFEEIKSESKNLIDFIFLIDPDEEFKTGALKAYNEIRKCSNENEVIKLITEKIDPIRKFVVWKQVEELKLFKVAVPIISIKNKEERAYLAIMYSMDNIILFHQCMNDCKDTYEEIENKVLKIKTKLQKEKKDD